MQYMLLIYSREGDWQKLPEADQKSIYQEYLDITSDLRDQGKFVHASQLQSTSAATTVTVRDDDTVVTDGPFAETKEALGGYYVLEAESLDEAIEWASRVPAARLGGAVEVRPLVLQPAGVS